MLMQGYFTYLLERELNTPGFLKRIQSVMSLRAERSNLVLHSNGRLPRRGFAAPRNDILLLHPFSPIQYKQPRGHGYHRFEDTPEKFLEPGPMQMIKNVCDASADG